MTPDPQQPPEDEFSLERRQLPVYPSSRSEPNGWIKFFRFMIWISPGPACLILVNLAYFYLSIHFVPGLLIAAIITLLIGACDAFLAPYVPKENGTPLVKPTIEHSLKFSLLQILIAPATIIILGFGACVVISIANA